MNAADIIAKIKKQIHDISKAFNLIFPFDSEDIHVSELFQLIFAAPARYRLIKVNWYLPYQGVYKLNSDGASKVILVEAQWEGLYEIIMEDS